MTPATTSHFLTILLLAWESNMDIGDTTTVLVDGNRITGTVYHIRENGWPCVKSSTGRIASGPVWRRDDPDEVRLRARRAETRIILMPTDLGV